MRWKTFSQIALAAGLMAAAPVAAQDRPKHLTLVGIPSGTVAPHGTVFGALSLTNRRDKRLRDNDGSLALGFGFGDADESLGFQVTMDIHSLSRSFGDSGAFGLKASRRIVGGSAPLYFGVSADYLAGWGDSKRQKTGVTAALTGFAVVEMGGSRHPVMYTLGAGNRVRDNDTRPGVFAGVGLGLTEHLAASIAWTGEAVDLGLGLRLPGLDRVNVTLAANDVTDRRNSRRLTASATWSLQNVFGR